MTAETTIPNGNTVIESMPGPIAKAIIAIMKEVSTITKDDKNKYGNYNFASVDAFLEETRPLCAKAGLAIIPMETARAFEKVDGKREGDSNTVVMLKYQFLLVHETGAVWTTALDQRSIRLFWTGAQTSGAAQSYVLKQYMRALFQIATGEPDADADPKVSAESARSSWSGRKGAGAQPKTQAAVHDTNGAGSEPSEQTAVLKKYQAALDNAHTKGGVDSVSKNHKDTINGLNDEGKEDARQMHRNAIARVKTAAALAQVEQSS